MKKKKLFLLVFILPVVGVDADESHTHTHTHIRGGVRNETHGRLVNNRALELYHVNLFL